MDKRKVKDIKRDKSVPIDLTTIVSLENDCFSKLWDLSNIDCVKCSEYDICMVVSLDTQKTRNKALEIKKRSTHYLDELDWENVPWDGILEDIKEGYKVSLLELRAIVKDLAKVVDNKTVNCKVQNWLIDNKIKVENGCLKF